MAATFLAVFTAALITDYFVVAIFLIALAIFVLLQRGHFKRLENALNTSLENKDLLGAVETISDRIEASVSDEPPLPPQPHVEIDLQGVEARLEELCQLSANIENRLATVEDRFLAVIETFSSRGERGRVVGLRERIEDHLAGSGYQTVTIVDETNGKETGTHRITVEVLKGTVPFKGYVDIEDGQVTAEHLMPIYEAFP